MLVRTLSKRFALGMRDTMQPMFRSLQMNLFGKNKLVANDSLCSVRAFALGISLTVYAFTGKKLQKWIVNSPGFIIFSYVAFSYRWKSKKRYTHTMLNFLSYPVGGSHWKAWNRWVKKNNLKYIPQFWKCKIFSTLIENVSKRFNFSALFNCARMSCKVNFTASLKLLSAWVALFLSFRAAFSHVPGVAFCFGKER